VLPSHCSGVAGVEAATSESAIDWRPVAALDSDGPARLDPELGAKRHRLRREDASSGFSDEGRDIQWPA